MSDYTSIVPTEVRMNCRVHVEMRSLCNGEVCMAQGFENIHLIHCNHRIMNIATTKRAKNKLSIQIHDVYN